MSTVMWIGFGFVVVLVGFLIVSFFKKETINRGQYNILRFLTALCAGFAASFFAGDALFKLEGEMANGFKIALTGTAGFAAFFAIWFTYKETIPIPKDAFHFSILNGWTFEGAVKGIAKAANGFCEIEGFSSQQLQLVLEAREIKSSSPVDAIKKLRYLNTNLPKYNVTVNENIYKIVSS